MESTDHRLTAEETARLELNELLCDILGSRNVYFQAPANVRMRYPAIKYELEDIQSTFANNKVYHTSRKYLVTLIDYNPDSPFIKPLSEIPTARFKRSYASNGLNHYVFTIFYK